MQVIAINLSQYHIELPRAMARTEGALSSARGSEHRLLCALHMTKAVAFSLFNSFFYLGDYFIRSAYITLFEGVQRGREHSLQQQNNYRIALDCSAFSAFLLFKSLFAGAEAIRPNIIIQNHPGAEVAPRPPQDPPQANPLAPEPPQDWWEQLKRQPYPERLTAISQKLTSNLPPESLRGLTPYQLAELLQGWLQDQLPEDQIQDMILNISQDLETRRFLPFAFLHWISKERVQLMLQDSYPKLLYNRLLSLFQNLSQQQLQDFTQNQSQEQLREELQEQLSYLHQDLFRESRKRLVSSLPCYLQREHWQNTIQDKLQNRLQNQLQDLQLAGVPHTSLSRLRKELITMITGISHYDGLLYRTLHIPKPTERMFHERFTALFHHTPPTSWQIPNPSGLGECLRIDLVADIILDLFIDNFLWPLQDLRRRQGYQDPFPEELLPNLYEATRQVLSLMVKGDDASLRNRNQSIHEWQNNLFQRLVASL